MTKRLLPLLLICTVATAACVKKGPTEPETPEPTGFSSTFTGSMEGYNAAQHSLTVPESGSLRARLTWTGGGDLDLYLTPGSCNTYPRQPGSGCELLEVSDRLEGSEEIITRSVSSGDQFKIWVDSFSPEGIRNYTVVVTID